MNETQAVAICATLLVVLFYLTARDVRRRDKAEEGILAAMNNVSPARLVVIALIVIVAIISGQQRI
ncbi:MAG: hypothetical protein L6367_02850 [Cellulomonas sp.]|nr:hypothetical protein [Cellulomonas sp.]